MQRTPVRYSKKQLSCVVKMLPARVGDVQAKRATAKRLCPRLARGRLEKSIGPTPKVVVVIQLMVLVVVHGVAQLCHPPSDTAESGGG